MDVRVEHRLRRGPAVVEHRGARRRRAAPSARRERHPPGDLEHPGDVVRFQIGQPVRVPSSDDQGVPRAERPDVEERQHVLVLVHPVRRPLAAHDRAEDAVRHRYLLGEGLVGVGVRSWSSSDQQLQALVGPSDCNLVTRRLGGLGELVLRERELLENLVTVDGGTRRPAVARWSTTWSTVGSTTAWSACASARRRWCRRRRRCAGCGFADLHGSAGRPSWGRDVGQGGVELPPS